MSKQHVWLIKVCKIEATPTNGTILPVSQLQCQSVGRWQTQNMISFPKKIMTIGLVPESLVRKSEPWMIHYFLKNTTPNPLLLHLHLYFCTCHQNIIFCVFVFNEFKFFWIYSACLPIFPLKMMKMKQLEMKLIFIFVIITWRWVGASIVHVL